MTISLAYHELLQIITVAIMPLAIASHWVKCFGIWGDFGIEGGLGARPRNSGSFGDVCSFKVTETIAILCGVT